jgi:hypothetical protein
MLTGCERIALEARFLQFTRPLPNGCLIWTGAQTSGGYQAKGKYKSRGGPYGSIWINKALNSKKAHIVWAYLRGIISSFNVPAGHHLDHECTSGTLCVSCIALVPDKTNLALRHTRNHSDNGKVIALDVARERRDRMDRERRSRARRKRSATSGNPRKARRATV